MAQLGSLRLQDVAQPVLPQRHEAGAFRQRAASQMRDGVAEENLVAVARIEESRQAVERSGEIVVVARLGGAGVQRHAHLWPRLWGRPGLGEQRALRHVGRGDPLRRRGEGRLRGVADGLEVDAAICRDGVVDDLQVALNDGARLGGIALPMTRALLDVGEEEGHRSRGKLGHG